MSLCMNFLESEKEDTLTRYVLCMIDSLVSRIHTERRQPGWQSITSKRLDIKTFGPLFVFFFFCRSWPGVLS